MKPNLKTPAAQHMLDLLSEVLAIARSLAPLTPARHGPAARKSPGNGVYTNQSKYNPWRAYTWDAKKGRNVYLGAFPSIVKARAARCAYQAGAPVTSGTKSAQLRRVA